MSGRARQGFTLMEILVAMTLLSLVFMAVANIYTAGISRWGWQSAQTDAMRISSLAMDRMTADIRNAMQFEIESAGGNTVYTFTLPANADASGNYTPQRFTSGLLYVKGPSVRYYLSNTTGSQTVTGGNILWRATAPAGGSTYTADTSWALDSANRPRSGDIQAFTISAVTGMTSAVQVSVTARGTAGSSARNYTVTRQLALRNTNQNVTTYNLDPKSTFIQSINSASTDPIIIDLDDINVQMGDTVLIEVFGGYSTGSGVADNTTNLAIGVFGSNDNLKDRTKANRVPGAHGTNGQSFNPTSLFPAIPSGDGAQLPEAFLISGGSTTVTVPNGSHYLYLGTLEATYHDNFDTNGDFKIRVTVL